MDTSDTDDESSSDTTGSIWSDVPEVQEISESREIAQTGDGTTLQNIDNGGRDNEDIGWSIFYTELLQARPRRALVHDVYRCTDEAEARNIAERIYRGRRGKQVPTEYRKKGFALISFHASQSSTECFNNIHVVHDCRWKDSSCRCGAFIELKLAPFFRRRVRYFTALSSEDVRLLSEYVL